MRTIILTLLTFFSSPSFAARGDVVSYMHLETVDARRLMYERKFYCPEGRHLGQAQAVKVFRIEYQTKGLKNREVTTKGLLLVPVKAGTYPLMVYQHGTLVGESELPSNFPIHSEARVVAACFASRGYISVAADYLGFGDETGQHPYLHAETEASTARDLMRAARKLSSQLKFQMTSQTFIAGYSQGGHAAMALLRDLEKNNACEFPVTATAPMAGPYNLAKTMAKVLHKPSLHSALEGAYVVAGLNQIYGFCRDFSEVIRPQFKNLIHQYFDGDYKFDQVLPHFSMKLEDLFQPAFLKLDLSNPNSKFRRALADNDVHRWIPKTPLRLYHGAADLEVPYFNTEEAYQYMKSRGAKVQLVNLGADIDHAKGFRPAVSQAALWFESLRVPETGKKSRCPR